MDRKLYAELISNIDEYCNAGKFSGSRLFVFGHCEASLTVIDEMLKRGLFIEAILDNSAEKQGIMFGDVPVVFPEKVLEHGQENTIVLLATRFYEQMNAQLRAMGYTGKVIKLVDYNTYSEYSLSKETLDRKQGRVEYGSAALARIKEKYKGCLLILCPFNALGDIYLCMSYLPVFLEKQGIDKAAVIVPTEGCMAVAELFGTKNVEVVEQKELDAMIQAALYKHEENCFIAHQDRPYIINLHKALLKKKIPLDEIYKIGVFGLNKDTKPVKPCCWEEYPGLSDIPEGRAAILSPYAKSVTPVPAKVWEDIVTDLTERGFKVYTNVCGDETELKGTIAISPGLSQMKSVVERTGLFIGIRSGLCDVLRTTECRKIALFPDYNYGDTRWKAIDMYALEEFENIVVGEDYKWQMN